MQGGMSTSFGALQPHNRLTGLDCYILSLLTRTLALATVAYNDHTRAAKKGEIGERNNENLGLEGLAQAVEGEQRKYLSFIQN